MEVGRGRMDSECDSYELNGHRPADRYRFAPSGDGRKGANTGSQAFPNCIARSILKAPARHKRRTINGTLWAAAAGLKKSTIDGVPSSQAFAAD